MPRTKRLAVVMVGLALLAGSQVEPADARTSSAERAEESPIRALPGLRTQINFWKKIFSVYSARQVVIHDALHLDRIYEVLDFRDLVDSGLSSADIDDYAAEQVRDEKERLRALLFRLHQEGPDAPDLSPDERRIAALFDKEGDPARFLEAAADDRIRSQAGLRERFGSGVRISRRYLPEMEAIFRREGLPVELTRLPLVESCFDVHAYSKVGAAGIWQFMPATGRLYMRVNDSVDERRDPIVSTEAAAQHLRRNYEVLGTWPLAVTAYNHGRGGMVRAVETVGSSDLVEIIKHYRGPAFKFASRNFYAEFLAALEVEREFEDNSGQLRVAGRPRTERVVVLNSTSFRQLVQAADIAPEDLAELNPALTRDVVSGRLDVPRGYHLRIPAGSGDGFERRYASLFVPQPKRASQKRQARVIHQVKRGQTLAGIARRYGTTVGAIRRHNKLPKTEGVRSGQNLVIPAG